MKAAIVPNPLSHLLPLPAPVTFPHSLPGESSTALAQISASSQKPSVLPNARRVLDSKPQEAPASHPAPAPTPAPAAAPAPPHLSLSCSWVSAAFPGQNFHFSSPLLFIISTPSPTSTWRNLVHPLIPISVRNLAFLFVYTFLDSPTPGTTISPT